MHRADGSANGGPPLSLDSTGWSDPSGTRAYGGRWLVYDAADLLSDDQDKGSDKQQQVMCEIRRIISSK